MLDQAECWILVVIFGADYHGIHTFCIFSTNSPLLGMEIVKLKQEVELWAAMFFYIL